MAKQLKKPSWIKRILVFLLCLEVLVLGGVLAVTLILDGITFDGVKIIDRINDYIAPSKPPVEVVNPEDFDGGDGEEPAPGDSITPIYRKAQKDANVMNILIVGQDARPGEKRGRSDATMILSYNKATGKAKMISILRDQLVPVEGKGWVKFNSAYSFGGVGLTINTVNEIYGLDIQKYVIVGFDGLIDVINTLGGVRVPITEKEANYYHKLAKQDVFMVGGKDIQAGGNVLLSGTQALVHARNRHLDSDWGRTRRQRDIMMGLYRGIKEGFQKNPASLIPLLDDMKKIVQTNLTANEIYSLATGVMKDDRLNIESAALPFEGTWQYGRTAQGGSIIDVDLVANKRKIAEYIYG